MLPSVHQTTPRHLGEYLQILRKWLISDKYAQLAEHPLPEMTRLSLSDLALRIKTMKVKIGNSIEDVLCRALDPPTPINVQRAIAALVEVLI
jgi:HrpA-like RNA helicase